MAIENMEERTENNDDLPLGEVDLLDEIVMALVNHPEKVNIIDETVGSHRRLIINVTDDDFGVVVGKHGTTLASIRSIMWKIAKKNKIEFDVDMMESSRRSGRDGTVHTTVKSGSD